MNVDTIIFAWLCCLLYHHVYCLVSSTRLVSIAMKEGHRALHG